MTVFRSLTKMWFRTSGMLASQSAGNFWFGITMALEDIAENITTKYTDEEMHILEYAGMIKRNLRNVWRWATYTPGGNQFLQGDYSKKKWQEVRFYLRITWEDVKELFR